MLDAPIWLGGKMVGIVCHEHVGVKRHWRVEEENFAGSIADFVSLSFETSDRKHAEEALRNSERRMADIINFLPDPTWVVDGAAGLIQYETGGMCPANQY